MEPTHASVRWTEWLRTGSTRRLFRWNPLDGSTNVWRVENTNLTLALVCLRPPDRGLHDHLRPGENQTSGVELIGELRGNLPMNFVRYR